MVYNYIVLINNIIFSNNFNINYDYLEYALKKDGEFISKEWIDLQKAYKNYIYAKKDCYIAINKINNIKLLLKNQINNQKNLKRLYEENNKDQYVLQIIIYEINIYIINLKKTITKITLTAQKKQEKFMIATKKLNLATIPIKQQWSLEYAQNIMDKFIELLFLKYSIANLKNIIKKKIYHEEILVLFNILIKLDLYFITVIKKAKITSNLSKALGKIFYQLIVLKYEQKTKKSISFIDYLKYIKFNFIKENLINYAKCLHGSCNIYAPYKDCTTMINESKQQSNLSLIEGFF